MPLNTQYKLILIFIDLVSAVIFILLLVMQIVNSKKNNVKLRNHYSVRESVVELDPVASIFCPSKRFNNIYTANKFPRNINFVYSNLQGMLEAGHFDEFINEISKTKHIHFCVVVETWLRRGVNSDKSIQIEGFKVFRSDRKLLKNDRNKGGGVAIYVKTNFKCSVIRKSYDDNSEITGAEYLMIEASGVP